MSTEHHGDGERRFWLLAAVIAVAGLAIHLGALRNGFTFDDTWIIVESPLVTTGSLWQAVTSHYWAGSEAAGNLWRPLTVATYWLNRHVFGPGPFSFHAVNLLLHAACCLLVATLARRLVSSDRPEVERSAVALVTALLFAVHPVHTEAVVSAVGRADVLAGLLTLAAWWFRARIWACAGLFGLALLSKENAMVLPALLAVEDAIRMGPIAGTGRATAVVDWMRKHAPVFAVLLFWLLLRLFVITAAEPADAPFLDASATHRILTGVSVLAKYAWLMLYPMNLSADYSFNQIPIVTSVLDAGFLGGVALIAFLGAVVWRSFRKVPVLAAGLCIGFAALFPVSNLPFGIGVAMAERLLYLPSFGLCLAAAAALVSGLRGLGLARDDVARRLPLAALSIALVPGVALAMRTINRTDDWSDQLTLFEATARTSPNSALTQVNLGSVYQSLGRSTEAESAYRRAIAIGPDRPGPHYNLATLLESQGRAAEAIDAYREAVLIDPTDVRALNNLGRALVSRGQAKDAIPWLEQAVRLNPSAPTPLVNLAAAYLSAGDVRHAEATIRRVLAAHPDDAPALRILAGIRAADSR